MTTFEISPEQDRRAQRLTIALVTGLMLAHNGHGEEDANTAKADIDEASVESGGLMMVLVFHALCTLTTTALTDFATLAGVDPLEYWRGIALATERELPL